MKSQKIKGFLNLLLPSLKELIKDRTDYYAAGLAYFQLLSLSPLVGFIIYIFSKTFGEANMRAELVPILQFWFPAQFVNVLKFMLGYGRHIEPSQLTSVSWIAGIALVWATKGFFSQIRFSVEAQWNMYKNKTGFHAFVERNIEDLRTSVISIIIMLVFVALISILPDTNEEVVHNTSPVLFTLFKAGRLLGGFLFLMALLLYFLISLPPIRIRWQDAIPGTVVGAALEVLGREIMKAHIEANPNAGVSESMLVMMAWFYYSSIVVLYASEFSKLYIARKYNLDVSKMHFD